MIIVELAQLFTSMASYNRLRVIVGEEKVVAYVHADTLWDICGGDGDADGDCEDDDSDDGDDDDDDDGFNNTEFS